MEVIKKREENMFKIKKALFFLLFSLTLFISSANAEYTQTAKFTSVFQDIPIKL